MQYQPERQDIQHLAHDVRGLLSCVLLEIEALDDHEDHFVRLRSSKLQKAADRLLDYCRAAQSAPEESTYDQSVSLTNTLEDATAFLILHGGDHNVDIRLKTIDVTLSPHQATAIHRMVMNLGRNAITAMQGKLRSRLSIETKTVRDTLRIDVIDNGPGLPEATLCQLLPSLHQPCVGGRIGLGIPSTRRLAARLGGDFILLHSGPTGAAFRITLPLSKAKCSDPTWLRLVKSQAVPIQVALAL